MATYHMEQASELLQEYFGYGSFHTGQEALIERILGGRDVLGIMPTGAGKSICYQIPAMMLPGVSIVISPLISLMKDQVDGLCKMGIPAALINSSVSPRELEATYQALEHNRIKLLYIAPERLETEGFLQYLSRFPISLIAVDEAHCVSQWGHDFRPSYRRIREMIEAFPTRPVVGAFTATATETVRQDILALLGLRTPFLLTTGFDRANLFYSVDSPGDRDSWVLDYLGRSKGRSGIVYCLTRKQVDRLSDLLIDKGFAALPYHAGLPDQTRRDNQDAFRNDTAEIIVATNAFGMGIDKSNVRFVLHYGMPKTLENYYQEAGRAGRDGEPADCILLYSAQDIVTNRFLIDQSSETGDKSADYRKLQDMIDYCNTDRCLRGYVLRYFGQEDIPDNCANCQNCSGDIEESDITVEAQKIISCVIRMGNRFGVNLVVQVLRGSQNQKVMELQFDKLSTYGIMREYSGAAIKELVSYLTAQGYLEAKGTTFPYIAATSKAVAFVRQRDTLTMRRKIRTAKSEASPILHHGLYEQLRQLRRTIAEDQGVPPYLVFSDATLTDMCRHLPRTPEEMLLVSGVGRRKMDQFGEEFLFAVREYMDEHNLESPGSLTGSRRKTRDSRGRRASGTVQETYALYEQGKSIEEIAEIRGLTEVSVENHLIKAAHEGKPVDLEAFIPPDQRAAIFEAIEDQGDAYLKPIKDALPESVTYTAIRFAVEVYRRGRKG
ncbi:DNA helicase RecQ [Ruminococcaceae bacterium OttesenSCG-928-L11]|nr:DNA helicase RecQ [Ruminococcaceae bacterium OttesenSCG-928-L11]